ncbi:MAG: rhodanese-like domain-containing protein [Runella sp.]
MFGLFKTKKSYESLSARDLDQFLSENPDAVLLDVRTPAEHRQHAIKKSINIDLMSPDFMSKINKLDKEKTYVVYCRSGNRSASACGAMASNGFTSLYNLSGGIMSY